MADKQKDFMKKKAVALSYDANDPAPKVIAKGTGYVADKIIAKGKEAAIPFYKDEKLAEDLTKINIGDNIPPELYEIVAQVLVFISDLDKQEQYKQYAGQ